jgi:hypothetical protein
VLWKDADTDIPILKQAQAEYGWGTPCVVHGSEIKSLGHPPRILWEVGVMRRMNWLAYERIRYQPKRYH